MTRRTILKTSSSAIALTLGCGLAGTAMANDDVMNHVAAGNMVMPSIDYAGWNYSPFDQINRENVDQLQLVWAMLLGADDEYEAQPLVVGNMMYIAHPVTDNGDVANYITAHDLTDQGRTVWEFRPDVDIDAARGACCGDQTRGLNYAEGNIYYTTVDGQAFALDAQTGEALWRNLVTDVTIREHNASNGIVIGDLYITGNEGGEYGTRGKVTALDIHTGQTQWVMYNMGPDNEVGIGPRFNPYYDDDKQGSLSTWYGNSWRHGGGTVWGYFTYDVERNMFYYGTGNCGPWNPDYRREWGVVTLDENGGMSDYKNNWCASLLARDATTGELIWAYNKTPADPWDLDEPLIHPLIQYNGQDAVVNAARNGWFYVWDPDTGQLLNQPWMHTFVDVILGVNTETGRPVYNYDTWAFTNVDDRRNYTAADPMAGIADPEDYTGTEVEYCPGTSARNWQNDVYNPVTGLLYTVNNTSCSIRRYLEGEYVPGEGYTLQQGAGAAATRWFSADAPVAQTAYTYESLRDAPTTEISNQLMANDPDTGTQVWTVDFTEGNDAPVFGTAGQLIFQGGKHDGAMHAYDADTGEDLWHFRTGSGFEGSAISFMLDGRQYIAIIGSQENSSNVDAGDGAAADERFRRGGSSLYVFALPDNVAAN